MLHFREHEWLLVPGASRLTAWIRPKDRTQEEITVAAHQIHEEEGCPDGLTDSHWLAAEDRLQR